MKRIKERFSTIAPVALTRLLQQAMMHRTFDEAIKEWKQRSGNMGQVDREELLADGAVQAADTIIEETLKDNKLPLNSEAVKKIYDAFRVVKLIPLSKLKGPKLEVIKAFLAMMKDQFRRAADLADDMAIAADALKMSRR